MRCHKQRVLCNVRVRKITSIDRRIIITCRNTLTYPRISLELADQTILKMMETVWASKSLAVRQRNKAISVMLRANFDGVTLRFEETPRPSTLPVFDRMYTA